MTKKVDHNSPDHRGLEYLTYTEPPADHRAAAIRCTARNATDADDLALLLDMLGLTPEEAR